jgi:hypothetical protein
VVQLDRHAEVGGGLMMRLLSLTATLIGLALCSLPATAQERHVLDKLSPQPAAIDGTNWTKIKEWRFGTNGGIASWQQMQAAGWMAHEPGKGWAEESYSPDISKNVVAAPDHVDLVALWTGKPLARTGQPTSGNGSVLSFAAYYNTSDAGWRAAPGYYEGTFKPPKAAGAWPAWWLIGHEPGTPPTSSAWGPEIDIFEFYGLKTDHVESTLHGNGETIPSFSFLKQGVAGPNLPRYALQAVQTQYVNYWPYNQGGILYHPSEPVDYAKEFHTYGVKINRDNAIEIWVDDIKVGEFMAIQFADDHGTPMTPRLVIDLALGWQAGPVDEKDFGGINYTGPLNKYRLSVQDIQLWRPQ